MALMGEGKRTSAKTARAIYRRTAKKLAEELAEELAYLEAKRARGLPPRDTDEAGADILRRRLAGSVPVGVTGDEWRAVCQQNGTYRPDQKR